MSRASAGFGGAFGCVVGGLLGSILGMKVEEDRPYGQRHRTAGELQSEIVGTLVGAVVGATAGAAIWAGPDAPKQVGTSGVGALGAPGPLHNPRFP